MTVRDSETRTIGAAASGLTAAKIELDIATVQIESDGEIRYWTSGQTPTPTSGFVMVPYDQILLTRVEALQFKAIRAGAVDVLIHAQYYLAI
jgi:hypothetical protein